MITQKRKPAADWSPATDNLIGKNLTLIKIFEKHVAEHCQPFADFKKPFACAETNSDQISIVDDQSATGVCLFLTVTLVTMEHIDNCAFYSLITFSKLC